MRAPFDSASAETLVGASVKLRGELSSEGDIQIEGEVTGNVTSGGQVLVGASGQVEGTVQALSVAVSGKLKGEIEVKEHVELRYSGRIEGNVKCQTIEIQTGGFLRGELQMTDPEKRSKPADPPAGGSAEG